MYLYLKRRNGSAKRLLLKASRKYLFFFFRTQTKERHEREQYIEIGYLKGFVLSRFREERGWKIKRRKRNNPTLIDNSAKLLLQLKSHHHLNVPFEPRLSLAWEIRLILSGEGCIALPVTECKRVNIFKVCRSLKIARQKQKHAYQSFICPLVVPAPTAS